MSGHRIAEVKPRTLEIPLDADAIEVVAGAGDAHQAVARQIATSLSETCGAEVRIADDSAYAGWDVRPERHAILVGSLGDNRAIEYLYHRWLAFADRSYPGPGGYALRSVWDPWGSGANAFVVGAAEPGGMEKASARLQEILARADGAIPRTHEVVYGTHRDREVEEAERQATRGPNRDGWVYAFTGYGDPQFIPRSSWVYVRSGDPRIAEGLRKVLIEFADSPALHASPNRIHLYTWPLMMAWPHLETSPAFSDADRLKITRFLFDILESAEASRNPHLIHLAETELPRQNHQTSCALLVLFGSLYFQRLYGLAETERWRALVDRFFRIGAYCSKQVCDNNAHGWNRSIGDFGLYAMLTGNTAFYDSGMARLAAERAVANCTSNGFVATVGDGGVEAYPTWFLAQTAFVLRDSGMRFALDNMAPEIARAGFLPPPARQAYDAGLEAKPPEDHVGTHVFPLDRLYYDIPKNAPGSLALKPPNVAPDETFDILTMRSGWEKRAQYLILDGTGGGSHSYEDANAILTLAQDDRFLLISPDRLYFTAPKNHNMVTVTRNGLGAELPSYCRLDGSADLPTFGFTSTTLPDTVGMDWTRSLIWRKGDFHLVIDRLRALDRATYSAICRWFPLGEPELADGCCIFRQSEWEGSRTSFTIQNLSGQACRIQDAFYGPPKSWRTGSDPDLAGMLHTDRTVLTELSQTERATLEAGEEIRFVNLFCARSGAQADEKVGARLAGSGWHHIETSEGCTAVWAGADGSVETTGMRATCGALAVWETGLMAAGCSALRAGDLSIQFSEPCGVEISGSGAITVDAPRDLTVLWRGNGEAHERELQGKRKHEWDLGPVALPDPCELGREGDGGPVAAAPIHTGADVPEPDWATGALGGINALHIAETATGPTVLAACEDGALKAFDRSGQAVWSYDAGAPVNTVHSGLLRAGEPIRIVLGCEDESVHAIDPDTRETVWRHQVEYGHQYWPWWSWYNAAIFRVFVDDLDGDGDGEVVVTSGNIRVRLLDASGSERWNYRTDHGLFLTYETADLDGDGKKEIVGGNDFLSSNSQCRVIGADGEEKHAFENAGWTSQLRDVLIADIDGDGKLEVVCAASRQESLRVHSFEEKACRWGVSLGEIPVGLALLQGTAGPVLFAATEGSTAVGISPTGDPLWRVDVAPGAAKVVRMGDRAAVVCVDGRVLGVDGDGAVETVGMLPSEVTAAAYADGLLVLGGKDGMASAYRVG